MKTIEEKLERIRKSCGVMNKLVTCVAIILAFAAIFYIIDLVYVLFISECNFSTYINSDGNLIIDSSNNVINAGNIIKKGFYPPNINLMSYSPKSLQIFNLIMCLVILIPVVYMLFSLSKLLTSVFNGGKPFTQENVKLLKVSSVLFFLFILYRPVYSLLSSVFVFSFDYYCYNINFDPAPIIFGFVLLILAQVFDYGRLLQTEYDETI